MPPEPPAIKGRAPASRGRGSWRLIVTLTAVILGMAGLVASAAGIASQVLPRKFTAAQQQQIIAWETAKRWRTMPAGKIFPASVPYQLPAYDLTSGSQLPLVAGRVGISRQASWPPGLILLPHGCLTQAAARPCSVPLMWMTQTVCWSPSALR
jgi:hypothetical protein